MIYQLWYSSSKDSYSFFSINNHTAKKLLEDDAQLIWLIEADTWEEACRLKNRYLGWEEYKEFEL